MIRVTCAIIFYNNRILVTQRGEDSEHPFLWEFPGGKIKAGELADDCVRREIREELEAEIEVIKMLNPVLFDYGFKKIKLIPFLCQVFSEKIELNSHIRANWVLPEDLNNIDFLEADKKLIQVNRKELEEYFGKQVDQPRQNSGPGNN